MNATPETFKPGERWLVTASNGDVSDWECLEWSPVYRFVKVRRNGESAQWRSDHHMHDLLERLPDVESGNNQAESPRRIEADSLIRFARLLIVNWPCRCDHCKVQKAKAYTRTEEAEQDAIESAQTKA